MRRTTTDTVNIDRRFKRRFNFWMVRQAQVVVTGKVNQFLTVNLDMRLLRALNKAVSAR